MPLHEYRCPVCHRAFETLRRVGHAAAAAHASHRPASRIRSLTPFAPRGIGLSTTVYGDRRPDSLTHDDNGSIKDRIGVRDRSRPLGGLPLGTDRDIAKEGA